MKQKVSKVFLGHAQDGLRLVRGKPNGGATVPKGAELVLELDLLDGVPTVAVNAKAGGKHYAVSDVPPQSLGAELVFLQAPSPQAGLDAVMAAGLGDFLAGSVGYAIMTGAAKVKR